MDREVAEQKEKLRDLYEDNQPTFLECVERLKVYQGEVRDVNDNRNEIARTNG